MDWSSLSRVATPSPVTGCTSWLLEGVWGGGGDIHCVKEKAFVITIKKHVDTQSV